MSYDTLKQFYMLLHKLFMMSCRKFQVLNFMLPKKNITTEQKNQILNYVSENKCFKKFITFRFFNTRACVSKGWLNLNCTIKKLFKHIVLKSTKEWKQWTKQNKILIKIQNCFYNKKN